MSSDGQITYNHEAIHDSCQALMQITGEIATAVEELVGQVKQNEAQYLSGATADAYGATARDISSKFDHEVQYLNTTAHSVLDGSQAILDEDRRLAGQFGG